MGNVEAHLDRVFEESAKETQSYYANKIVQYKLYDNDMCNIIKEGKCTVNSCSYSRSLDCNIYSVTDVDTGENFSGHQFRLKLSE